jgi:hypothetical protein
MGDRKHLILLKLLRLYFCGLDNGGEALEISLE